MLRVKNVLILLIGVVNLVVKKVIRLTIGFSLGTVYFRLTDTKTEPSGKCSKNLGNLTLESTARPAGTETRHDILVHDDLLHYGLFYGRQGRDIAWSNRVVYSALVIVEEVIVDVVEEL